MSQDRGPAGAWPQSEGWNHEAGLGRLRKRGWRPRYIYDIGASNGVWTDTASRIFPLAEFHLFEPLVDVVPGYVEDLRVLMQRPGRRIVVHSIALDATAGTQRFGIAAQPMGSSMLATVASEYFPQVVEVKTATLDGFVQANNLPPPDLLKIDTQGAEMRILAGGERTLSRAAALLLEVWLERGYGPETPLMHEVVAWLAQRDFYVADTVGEYREAERLVSVDLLFLRLHADIDRP